MRRCFALLSLPVLLLFCGLPVRAQHAFQTLLPGLAPAEKRPVVQTADGGLCVLARQDAAENEYSRFVLIKTNADGNIEWARRYLPEGSNDYPTTLQSTPDGGFLVVGNTTVPGSGEQDIIILRLNEHGYPIWSRTYHQSELDCATDAVVLEDGSAVIVGNTQAIDSFQTPVEEWNEEEQTYETTEDLAYEYAYGTKALIFRIDPDGEVVWGKLVRRDFFAEGAEETRYSYQEVTSLVQAVCLRNNTITMIQQTGYMTAFQLGLVTDITLDGQSLQGLAIMSPDYYGKYSFNPFLNDILASPNGGCLVAGTIRYHQDYDRTLVDQDAGFLISLDAANEVVWNKTYSTDNAFNPFPLSILPLDEGRYLLAGRTLINNIYVEENDNPIIGVADRSGNILEAKEWITNLSDIPFKQAEDGEIRPFLQWPLFTSTDDQGAVSVGRVVLHDMYNDYAYAGGSMGMMITRFNPDLTPCGDDEANEVTIKSTPTLGLERITEAEMNDVQEPLDVTAYDYRSAYYADIDAIDIAAPDIAASFGYGYGAPDTAASFGGDIEDNVQVSVPMQTMDIAVKDSSPAFTEVAEAVEETPSQVYEPTPDTAVPADIGNAWEYPSPIPAYDTSAIPAIAPSYSFEDDYEEEYEEEYDEEEIEEKKTAGLSLTHVDVPLRNLEIKSRTLPDLAVEEITLEPYFICQDQATPVTSSLPEVEEPTSGDYLRLMPNSTTKGKSVAVEFRLSGNQKPQMSLISIGQGQAVRQISPKDIIWSEGEGNGSATIGTDDLAAGVYLVQIRIGTTGTQLAAKLEVR